MDNLKPETIHYRNAIYSGYLANKNTFQISLQGPGILLLDDSTCIISNWASNKPHASLSTIILPNRFVVYPLGNNLIKMVNPKAGICLYENIKQPHHCVLEAGQRVFIVNLNEKLRQEEIEDLGQMKRSERKRIIFKQFNINQSQSAIYNQMQNQYRFFIKRVEAALKTDETIFHKCSQFGHSSDKKDQRETIMVGVKFLHPNHEGNGLNLRIHHNNTSFQVGSIQIGSEKTRDKYVNMAISGENDEIHMIEKINGESYSYLYSPEQSKPVLQTITKIKKFYHIKSNNLVNKFFPLDFSHFQRQIHILNTILQKNNVHENLIAQSILEQGEVYLSRQANINDIKQQLAKVYAQKYNKSPCVSAKNKMRKSFTYNEFVPQTPRKSTKTMANDYIQTINKKQEKMKKNRMEKQIQKQLQNIRKYSGTKTSPRHSTKRQSFVYDFAQDNEEQESDYVTKLAESYLVIQEEMKTEARNKRLPMKKFPCNASRTTVGNKSYCTRFS